MEKPSKSFQKLVHAIVAFYGPSWFWIKTHPKSIDGPKNLMAMIQFSRKLEKPLQKIVQRVIQRNGYFAHPKAILLAMLADDDDGIRARAVNTILTMRMKTQEQTQVFADTQDGRGVDEDDDNVMEEEINGHQMNPLEKDAILSSTVRQYVIPKINFEATEYPDLID